METVEGIKRAVFLDSRSTADIYIRNKKNSPELLTELVVAMNPLVRSYLAKNGVETENTLKYFTNKSHVEILEKSKILVDWLRENSKFADLGIGVEEAHRESFVFWMRLAIHYCLFQIEVVLNAVDIHCPKTLSAASSSKRRVLSLYVEPEEKYLGYIVKTVCQNRSLTHEDISKGMPNGLGFSILWHISYLCSLVKFLFKYIYFQLYDGVTRDGEAGDHKKRVLFTSKSYQMDKFADKLKPELLDYKFHFLKNPALLYRRMPNFAITYFQGRYAKEVSAQKRFFKELDEKIQKNSNLFSYRGISFAEVILSKIRDNVADYIVGQLLWTVRLNQYIDTLKPSAIISNGTRSDDLILAEICRHKKIPAVLISHGSHVRPKNIYENIEWGEHGRALLRGPFSHIALQTPLAKDYLSVFSSSAKSIATGPLIWGKPIRQKKEGLLPKVILHAGTPKIIKGFRPYVYETSDEYIQALCDLASVVKNMDNVVLVVRFRPTSEIGIKDLLSLVPFSKKVVLSLKGSFSDVLGIADVLVSFSSTTIEEALQNRIPVLLYGGGGRYQHIPAYEIMNNEPIEAKAIYSVSGSESLGYAVLNILKLDLSSGRSDHLFDNYIYSYEDRASLGDMLKQ